jgi:hypothetical protein
MTGSRQTFLDIEWLLLAASRPMTDSLRHPGILDPMRGSAHECFLMMKLHLTGQVKENARGLTVRLQSSPTRK